MDQTKTKRKVAWLAGFAIAAALALVLTPSLLFNREPRHGGKTVTQWLDSMALFDEERRLDQTGQAIVGAVPEAATNDAALRALAQIGPRAVPTLIRRLAEPADWLPK